jgi:hypothetical protein
MLKFLVPILLLFSCFTGNAQEITPERITTYSFNLNKLKTQNQVTSIESSVKLLDNVADCKLDWLNYNMTVKVKEGGLKGFFSMEKLKAILLDNNAALQSFTKESKQL